MSLRLVYPSSANILQVADPLLNEKAMQWQTCRATILQFIFLHNRFTTLQAQMTGIAMLGEAAWLAQLRGKQRLLLSSKQAMTAA
jgi:hypothetical protein